jgi:ABC-2 type transport system ATP-binding protein
VSAPVSLVEFRRVFKTYSDSWSRARDVPAVRDVTLRVGPGEVFGLLGPNRAGKTTLIKLLLSLARPTSGEVLRLGQPLSDRATLRQVGYVHENHAFPKYLTARTLLEYYGALSFVPEDVLKPRIGPLLERVGLADRADESIARFSKGMLQRLGIAQALVNEPRLLVLDEPTEGLDLEGRVMLRGVVAEILKKGGSVLLVSHVATEIEQLCSRVGILVRGQLVHQGPLADLLKGATGPRSLEVALGEMYQRGGA